MEWGDPGQGDWVSISMISWSIRGTFPVGRHRGGAVHWNWSQVGPVGIGSTWLLQGARVLKEKAGPELRNGNRVCLHLISCISEKWTPSEPWFREGSGSFQGEVTREGSPYCSQNFHGTWIVDMHITFVGWLTKWLMGWLTDWMNEWKNCHQLKSMVFRDYFTLLFASVATTETSQDK